MCDEWLPVDLAHFEGVQESRDVWKKRATWFERALRKLKASMPGDTPQRGFLIAFIDTALAVETGHEQRDNEV